MKYSREPIQSAGQSDSHNKTDRLSYRTPVEKKAAWFRIWQEKYANRNSDSDFPRNSIEAHRFLEKWTAITRASPKLRYLEKSKNAHTDQETELLVTHWMRAQIAWYIDRTPRVKDYSFEFNCRYEAKLKFVPGGRYLLLVDEYGGIDAVRLPFPGGLGEIDEHPLKVVPLMTSEHGQPMASDIYVSEPDMYLVDEGISFNIAIGLHWNEGAQACFQVWNISTRTQGGRLRGRLLASFGAPNGINLRNLQSIALSGASVVLNLFEIVYDSYRSDSMPANAEPNPGVHIINWQTVAALVPAGGRTSTLKKYPWRYIAGSFNFAHLLSHNQLVLVQWTAGFRIQLLDLSTRPDTYWPSSSSYHLEIRDREGFINGQHAYRDCLIDQIGVPNTDYEDCYMSAPFACSDSVKFVMQMDSGYGYRQVYGLRIKQGKLKLYHMGSKTFKRQTKALICHTEQVQVFGFNTTVTFDAERGGLSFISYAWPDDDRLKEVQFDASETAYVPCLRLPRDPDCDMIARDVAFDEGYGRVAFISSRHTREFGEPWMSVKVIDTHDID